MKPEELKAICEDAIRRFKAGEMFSDGPFVGITLVRDRNPASDQIRLFGRTGPYGKIANVQFIDKTSTKVQVVAYFNAEHILNWMMRGSLGKGGLTSGRGPWYFGPSTQGGHR